jgi:hypothetical protein
VSQNYTFAGREQVQDANFFPIAKGCRLLVDCHAGPSVVGIIPQSKLIFRSKSKSQTDYHCEIKPIVSWSEEEILPNTAPD